MRYTHEEFMEKKGKKALEDKGYKVENGLIVYIEKKARKKFTKTQLRRMKEEEQVKILRAYGVTVIPELEGNRIKKIMELDK